MHFSVLFKFCPVCGSKSFVSNNEKSMICKDCGFVYYMNASAAVAAFIVNDNNELLVCTRAKEPAKGKFDLPGGFVDGNETADEAVRREIAEELNVQVTDSRFIFSLPNDYLYSGLTVPTLDLFFVCKIDNYKNIQAADDVESIQFIALDQLNIDDFGLNSIKKGISIYCLKSF